MSNWNVKTDTAAYNLKISISFYERDSSGTKLPRGQQATLCHEGTEVFSVKFSFELELFSAYFAPVFGLCFGNVSHRRQVGSMTSPRALIMETLGLNGCSKWRKDNATRATRKCIAEKWCLISVFFFGRSVEKFLFRKMWAIVAAKHKQETYATWTKGIIICFTNNCEQAVRNYTCKWCFCLRFLLSSHLLLLYYHTSQTHKEQWQIVNK